MGVFAGGVIEAGSRTQCLFRVLMKGEMKKEEKEGGNESVMVAQQQRLIEQQSVLIGQLQRTVAEQQRTINDLQGRGRGGNVNRNGTREADGEDDDGFEHVNGPGATNE